MKRIVVAIAVVILILMNTTAYLILYKKYNDIVDYFNQDSQLTAERLEGLEAKLKEIRTEVDSMGERIGSLSEANQAALDDKLSSSQERMGTAVDETRKALSSKIADLDNDVAAIKQKLGIKQPKNGGEKTGR